MHKTFYLDIYESIYRLYRYYGTITGIFKFLIIGDSIICTSKSSCNLDLANKLVNLVSFYCINFFFSGRTYEYLLIPGLPMGMNVPMKQYIDHKNVCASLVANKRYIPGMATR
jgi:hypothetical protein